jgi:hypothetical protein
MDKTARVHPPAQTAVQHPFQAYRVAWYWILVRKSGISNARQSTGFCSRDSACAVEEIVTRMSARRNRMKLRPIASLRSKDGLVPT